MKLKLAAPAVLGALLLFYACEKTNDHQNPPLKNLSPEEMLVKQSWQIDEVWRSISGKNSHYIKNVENTTAVKYERIRISFKNDGKGSYTDENNVTHPLTWNFTSASKKDMQLVIGPPTTGGGTFTWHLVEISDKSLTNTTSVGTSVLVSARYIPVVDSVVTNK